MCDRSAVHPSTNQSQNAMLPGAPHSMMTQEEESAVRWRVEIRAEMRALTRDSGKEVSVQKGDFWCGNDWVKSEHVWWLWLDRRTTQERRTEPYRAWWVRLTVDMVAIPRLSITNCLHESSVNLYDKTVKYDNEGINLFLASSDSDFASLSTRLVLLSIFV